jgi:hypothetical protein
MIFATTLAVCFVCGLATALEGVSYRSGSPIGSDRFPLREGSPALDDAGPEPAGESARQWTADPGLALPYAEVETR